MTARNLHDLSTMDTFDSLDLIERMEELQTMKEDIGLTDEEKEELEAIEAVNKEGEEATSDWRDGVTCVQDSYFKEYAMELARDAGVISGRGHWPMTCIDWDMAARELQRYYCSIKVDGVTFWVR